MEFLEAKQLDLNKAGYLISKDTKKPVTHVAYVQQQKAAEYTVKLAEAIKDKTFTAAKADNLDAIKAEVLAAINIKSIKEFVPTPEKPVSKVNDEMVKYALDFVKFEESKTDVEKINKLMAEFSSIDDVENVGEYFSEGLSKLTKIYTIKEVLAAVKITVEKLK